MVLSFRAFRPRAVLAAVLLVLLAPAVTAQSSDSGTFLGPLAVAPYSEPVWSAAEEGGWFVFSNTTDPNAIRYHFASFDDGIPAGGRTISANVFARPMGDGPAMAGLIANLSEDPLNYVAFMIDGRNGVGTVLLRTDDGMEQFRAETTPPALLDGTDVVAIEQRVDGLTLVLNGETAFTLDIPNPSPVLGVVVVGSGNFGYWNLNIE